LPKLNKKIGTPKLAPLPKANMQVYKPSVMWGRKWVVKNASSYWFKPGYAKKK
jgi:hypothetical protein